MLAMREHISKYADPKEADAHVKELEIHMRHFEEAMKKIRPLSTQELNMYKNMAEQFGKPELPAVEEEAGSGVKQLAVQLEPMTRGYPRYRIPLWNSMVKQALKVKAHNMRSDLESIIFDQCLRLQTE